MLAALLLMTSMAALAVDAQRPVNDEPTGLKESECYKCHSTGGGSLGPPLPLLYILHGPGELSLKVDEKKPLDVGVENAWVSELNSIVGIADVSEAPCIGFASDREPESTLIEDVVEQAPGTGERVDRHTITVQPGASDLVITMTPSGPVADQPNMELRIWTPGSNPDRSAHNFEGNRDGNAYTWEIHGAEQISALGVGEWTVDVVVVPPTTNPTAVSDQPYTLEISQDFRVTGEDRQFTGSPEVLKSRVEEPSKLTYVSWLVTASCIPTEASTINVDVELIAYYAHGSTQISQYDDWKYIKNITIEVVPEGDSVILRTHGTVIEEIPAAGFAWDILSEIIGYLSAVLILASIYTGGMFGKASRRQLNTVFGNAKRRVAFHNFLSYGIVLAALIHMIIFLFEAAYDWTLGIIWGGIAILAMFGLGVTGALQVPMIRKWNYAVWRWSHFYLSIGTIVFTIVHILLDGAHFVELQERIGWSNPFTRA